MSKCHFAAALALVLAACAAHPPKLAAPAAPALPPPSSKYYSDDGPPLAVPGNLDAIPDAVPRLEPLHRFANRPYTVLGREYVPATSLRPYRERGTASCYGRKFHGQKTSIGEVYDMFAMTAAHPTLPLPSYARVTNAANGRSVIVRVNDRGPFLHGRVIDLSYAAAHRRSRPPGRAMPSRASWRTSCTHRPAGRSRMRRSASRSATRWPPHGRTASGS